MTDIELRRASIVAVAVLVAMVGANLLLPGSAPPEGDDASTMSFERAYVAAIEGEWWCKDERLSFLIACEGGGVYGAVSDGGDTRAWRLDLVDAHLDGTLRFVGDGSVICICRVDAAMTGFSMEWREGQRRFGPAQMTRSRSGSADEVLEAMREAVGAARRQRQ